MSQVFCVAELFDEILSYLPQHTHTVAARVCRLWFAPAIEHIWETVSLNDLLGVLSPFDEDGFQQPLSSESWRRFFLYSKHIHRLQCHQIQYAALRQAILWGPEIDLLFSKLTILQWSGPPEYIEYLPSLVTSALQILQVQLDTINNPNMLNVLHKTIPLRSPSLRAFELSFPAANKYTRAVSQSLARLFSLLSGLVLVILPSHCMTRKLFTTLSRLPQLQDLSLGLYTCSLYMHTDVEDLPKQKIIVDGDKEASKDIPFRSLGKLDISCPDYMTTEVLRRGIQLPKLVDLTYSGLSLNHTIAFMDSLHRICPNLEKISIFANGNLPFPVIRPLLKCPALVEMISEGTIDIKVEDMITIATDRSSWRVISLPSVKPLSYQALVPFAQNCPDLYELDLTLDSKLGVPDPDTLTADVKFSSLTLLDVGFHSVFTPDFGLVSFLSKICSKPIKIRDHGTEESRRLWKTVEELVNFIITTQLQN